MLCKFCDWILGSFEAEVSSRPLPEDLLQFVRVPATLSNLITLNNCRYTDFKVNEIDLKGRVLRLTSLNYADNSEQVFTKPFSSLLLPPWNFLTTERALVLGYFYKGSSSRACCRA